MLTGDRSRVFYLLILPLTGILIVLFYATADARSPRVAVLLSREISPYVAMVAGLEAELPTCEVQRFFLDERGRPYSLIANTSDLDSAAYAALVGVGPEALRYLQTHAAGRPVIYSMVLNPANVMDPAYPSPCGVSLNLPVQAQLNAIRTTMPTARRIGVFFDPANNAPWFAAARNAAAPMGLHLVPVQVESRHGRISIIGEYASLDALLFIPDKSIISKAVVRHVIKSAASRGIPVIGYNSFFYSSGAAMVFAIDYAGVGRQTATLVKQALEGRGCSASIAPDFTTRTNPIVFESLKQYRE